jgi:hypothetical protein
MISLFKLTLVGLSLFVIMVAQAKPLVESSNTSDGKKSTNNNQQLYEIYKIMRLDPRFASVSNNDLVSYIYRNFVYKNNGDDVDSIKQKYPNQQQQQD